MDLGHGLLLTPQRRLCFHWLLFFFSQDYVKTAVPVFTRFVGKVAHGPWKKALDFGGNPDHVRIRLWLWLGGTE